MKSKNLKKIQLNKKSISSLMQNDVKGGNTTTIIRHIPPTTLCSTWCADTIDDNTCGYCTIA